MLQEKIILFNDLYHQVKLNKAAGAPAAED